MRLTPLLALTTLACVHAPPTPRPLPLEVRWFRNSAEYRAITLQTYRLAAEHLPMLIRGVPAGTWGVILDVDETVLDNSAYQVRRAAVDSGYTDASWDIWLRSRASVAIPGAVGFTERVHALGGRVVLVTNRLETFCPETRENLAHEHIAADLVLCAPPDQRNDKNPRFQRVLAGTAGLPPLTIVEWIGDNIQDFPGLKQDVRDTPAALNDFGMRFFVLPNPMYGSWTTNTSP
jgi:5'-nucleotidase (lipoprotein e(P4) family)